MELLYVVLAVCAVAFLGGALGGYWKGKRDSRGMTSWEEERYMRRALGEEGYRQWRRERDAAQQ